MKKLLKILIFIFVFLFGAASCAAMEPNGKGDGNSPLYELNDLRNVVGSGWDYAFVAGDCVFGDSGYFKFADALEKKFKEEGILTGNTSGELFFMRGEEYVYGVYRIAVNGGKYAFYAVSSDYTANGFKFSKIGNFDAEDAFIGGEGENCVRYFLIDGTVISYDLAGNNVLGRSSLPDGVEISDSYDFTYFQRGGAAAFFGNGKTYIYYPHGEESFIEINGDYSNSVNPAVINDTYIFGNENGEIVKSVSLNGSPAEDLSAEYADYVKKLNSSVLSCGEYSVYLQNGMAVIENRLGEKTEISAETVADNVAAVRAAVDKRKREGMQGDIEIVSVKVFSGEIFIILEKDLGGLIGVRDINEGIPQIAVRYDTDEEKLYFCGLVDLTGYNIYKVIKL